MPRSGTTWIGKIFDSHTRTLYRHEPDTWNKISQIPFLEDVVAYESYCAFVQRYVTNFIRSSKLEINGKLPIFKKSYSSKSRQQIYKISVYLSRAAKIINSNINFPVVSISNRTIDNGYIVVWKSIQLLGRFGIIANCLEDSKGVHILRHPCGYISSVLRGEESNKFMSGIPASEDYPIYENLAKTTQAMRYELNFDKFMRMKPIERLAWRWVLFNEKAIDDTANNPNIKILKYEEMCEEPFLTTKKYFDFCGLEMCDQTRKFLALSTQRESSSYYSVFKNPKEAAKKWKKILKNNEITLIEKIIAETKVGKYYC